MPEADYRERIEVRLDPETAADLEALARFWRITPSAAVRQSVAAAARRELPERHNVYPNTPTSPDE